MTTFQIQCFLAVAEHLNFTEAANQLFMAQSSLSRNVSNLETEIGMQLFIRTKKYVRLTPAGVVLYEEFKKLLAQGQVAIERARRISVSAEGTLSIGINESQKTETFLPQTLDLLHRDHPNIQFDFFSENFKELRAMLENGDIDIALTLGLDLEDYLPLDVVYQAVLLTAPLIAISALHPLANRKTLQIEDLRNDTMLTIDPAVSSGGYNGMVEMCKLHGFTPREIITKEAIGQILPMIEGGMGFSILDENSKYVSSEAIRTFPIQEGNTVNVVAIWLKKNFNPAIPLFVNLLMANNRSKLTDTIDGSDAL